MKWLVAFLIVLAIYGLAKGMLKGSDLGCKLGIHDPDLLAVIPGPGKWQSQTHCKKCHEHMTGEAW